MQLSDRDINTLKAIIQRVRTKDDYELARKIASRIKSKLNIDYNGQDDQFLVILLKDYNYYSGN
jgi:transcriptional regulatory protein LevR